MTETTRHFLPDATPEAEALEDARPLLFPVSAAEPGLTQLWLGNLTAAEDAQALEAAGITATLNLAINIFPGPVQLPSGVHVRRYQIGMLDGPGNDPAMLAAAVQLVDGLAGVYVPGKPHYPPHAKGGLLVHCRGGRSRSVTVLALWLHLRRREDFPTLDAALHHLRQVRGQDESYPLPPMIALARAALDRGLIPA
ncbi:dual specificity protein phosphatase family protein [Maritimibacter alkaliphilus]|uniref:dual specificity protein phosphatase family protein n=1 Tax=Maritimibacter alkaliphilus TaxID=404236 RepID=UPI001C96647C|nr:dual specificity protein phosphatase [Maritimibacter alkaliphilus]MBY6089427.1 dual specificity protein phosphatase family protein [Maritimibacter alkaliphilus]